jgi:hypothetical protein
LLGCPKAAPNALEVVTRHGEGLQGAPADAGVNARLEQLEAEAHAAIAEADEALWRHWTQGAPLELKGGHEGLFSVGTLEYLRTETSERARHLEAFVVSELLSRALASDTEAIASLEAGATFTIDGREVAWRDLSRLLLSEKSAVKRRALWTGSLQVVERLSVLLAHRDEKERAVLASLGAPSPLELWAAVREVDVQVLAAEARTL